MSNLAKTAFTTGVDETLAAVDAYGQSTADAALGSAGLGGDFDVTSLTGLLGGNQGDPATLLEGVTENQQLLLNADGLKSNLVCAIPGVSGTLSSMNPNMASGLLSGGGLSSITATVKGVTALVGKADLSSLTGLGVLIGAVSGSAFPISLKDNAGLAALGTGLLKQATSLGIPGAYGQMATGLTSSGDLGMLTQITRGILPSVISSSNIRMLSEIASGPLGKSLTSLAPGFTKALLSAFKLPAGTTAAGMVGIGTKLTTSLNVIQPSWNRTVSPSTRSPVSSAPSTVRSSATPVLNGSPDLRRVITAMASAKITPVVVRPSVTRIQTPTQVPNPVTEFPAGTTSTSYSNPDGSTTTVYTQTNGTTCTRTALPSGGNVTSAYLYPAQPLGAPPVNDEAVSAYLASVEPVVYNVEDIAIENEQALENIPVDPSVFGVTSYGAGAYATGGTSADGSLITKVILPNGGTYIHTVYPDGSVVSQKVESADPALINTFGPPTDPFANWAALTASDDTSMNAAIIAAHTQAQEDDYSSDTPSYLTLDAGPALQQSFPDTYFGEDPDW
jgi:hypothetical protein